MIELRLLKYFIAIVEEGSFSRAADRLHITQPTLSRQIHDLEEFYETKLIDRTKHRYFKRDISDIHIKP